MKQAVDAEVDAETADGDSIAGNSDSGDVSGSESLTFGGSNSGTLPWNTPNASSGGWVRGGLNRFRSNVRCASTSDTFGHRLQVRHEFDCNA